MDEPSFTVSTRDRDLLDVASLDAIWFRRWNHPQRNIPPLADPAQVEVVHRSCSTTLLGGLLTSFHGAWVSTPEATRRAENKLVQLRAAQAAGFVVPRTLISQDPLTIRAFCAALPSPAVIKPVHGTPRSQLFSLRVTDDHLSDDDALRMCPTIFQEYVSGHRHLRVLCCGRRSYAVQIETERLDWRLDLDTPMSPVRLEAAVERQKMFSKIGSDADVLRSADGLQSQGLTLYAIAIIKNGLEKRPQSADLWVGLGNELVIHSGGMMSPAAQLAFQRAEAIAPDHPGPPFFMGLAYAQAGQLDRAETVWRGLLDRSPANASWRPELEQRLLEIERMKQMGQ